jgi:hypothetical protein
MDFALPLVSIGGEFAPSYGFERGAGGLSQRDDVASLCFS